MWRRRDGVRHLQSALSIYLERARPPRVQLQCAHNICTPLYSSLPRPIPPPTVGGGHTVQLGHTIYISCSWTLARLSYLHNRHKGVRVRWLEVVALSAPLRLVVPMDRTPEIDNSKIHSNGAHTMRQHASWRSLPAIFLRQHASIDILYYVGP